MILKTTALCFRVDGKHFPQFLNTVGIKRPVIVALLNFSAVCCSVEDGCFVPVGRTLKEKFTHCPNYGSFVLKFNRLLNYRVLLLSCRE